MMKEGMYLRLHTVPEVDDVNVSVGDTFKIVEEDDYMVAIIVEENLLAFSKEPDSQGASYATWFDVVTEVQ